MSNHIPVLTRIHLSVALWFVRYRRRRDLVTALRDAEQYIMALQESNASMAKCIQKLGQECLVSDAQIELYLRQVGAVYE